MKKYLILALLFSYSITAEATDKNNKPPVPEIFTESDLKGENPDFLTSYLIIGNYEQRLQMSNGRLSKKPGRVLAIQKDEIMYISFYYLTESGRYRKIGRTIALKNNSIPRQDMHPEYNIPCLVIPRENNQGTYRIYLYNGNAVIQKAQKNTTNK